MATEIEQKQIEMVEEQLAGRGIRDKDVLRAMAEVPRQYFVHPQFMGFAYEDTPLPIQSGQTISQPYIVARMAELLELKATDKVLDVGTGSGYAAAVMSRIVAKVYTIERHKQLAHQAAKTLAALKYDNVLVRQGDGTLGWPEHAPYDAIMVAAGGPEVPPALLSQLAINGCLIIPIGEQPQVQKLKRIRRLSETKFEHQDLGGVRFVPLIGAGGWHAEEVEERP